ncbi:TonB-dependent receptor [Nafulsella turpanensis]|uniref:TonB-dependent receptor n=1 Tax=Nafulsella turpanensis TaxID=1265690 RepID=UPI000345617A|nr:TonB-dependent receptor [Nafulsella turpanensis]
MPVKFPFLLLLFCIGCLSSNAQNLHQQLSGFVLQKESLEPIANAQLLLQGEDKTYQVLSNDEGFFLFKEVLPSRYRLTVHHVAFAPQSVPEIMVRTSKPEKLTLYLEGRPIVLKEVNVDSDTPLPLAEGLNHTIFTMEETQRFAATFYDPARLMLSQPGVTGANDQNNQLVVHGQSPNHLSWHIEGGEILSPTHLPNAGTFSDRPSVSGGGVNILSAQLMGRSNFYTGLIPAGLGSAVGGVFNIRLREGSSIDYNHTLQASLLGIDLATEGPINKESGSSYLLNYRYSTVGLLSQLGVDFGNEAISYQDFSFHLSFPSTKLGSFSVFGLGGLSTTDHFLPEEVEEWQVAKDGTETELDAGMGATGIRHELSLGDHSSLRNILTFSIRSSNYNSQAYTPRLEVYSLVEEELRQELLAFKSEITTELSPRLTAETGVGIDWYNSSITAFTAYGRDGQTFTPNLSYTSIKPYGSLRYRWSAEWMLHSSLGLLFDSYSQKIYPEPGLSLHHILNEQSSLELVYGLRSQPTLRQPHLTTSYTGEENPLEPVRSHYSALGYNRTWNSGTRLSSEVFYQYFYQVPVSTFIPNFSALNLVETYAGFPLRNEGKGRTYGVDASLQKFFTSDFYYLASLSLFDASYLDSDGQWRNMQFNSQYNASLTTGKEWVKEKEGHLRIIGLNIRGLYRGGYWYTPILEDLSSEHQRTIFDYNRAFSQRLPPYYSFDLRLSHTKQKKDYLRTWALDIQNVTNRQNISWYYYDQLTQQVEPMYQLGIIPVIAYRLEF